MQNNLSDIVTNNVMSRNKDSSTNSFSNSDNNNNSISKNGKKESSGTVAATLMNDEMIKWQGDWLGNWNGRFVAVPNPSALANLLECLAYFELGKSAITHDTLKLI